MDTVTAGKITEIEFMARIWLSGGSVGSRQSLKSLIKLDIKTGIKDSKKAFLRSRHDTLV